MSAREGFRDVLYRGVVIPACPLALTAQRTFDQLTVWPDRNVPALQLPIDAVESRYYIRVMALDKPGVFAQISTVLGQHDISIRSALQREPVDTETGLGVPVVITTHDAREGNIRKAICGENTGTIIKGEGK